MAQAIEAEVAMFLARYADRRDAQGRHAVVRNGSLPEREVHTGVGAVRVKVPRVRDRSGTGLRFHSALLPPYLRRSQSLAALLPGLSLQGVSTGDFWQGKSHIPSDLVVDRKTSAVRGSLILDFPCTLYSRPRHFQENNISNINMLKIYH